LTAAVSNITGLSSAKQPSPPVHTYMYSYIYIVHRKRASLFCKGLILRLLGGSGGTRPSEGAETDLIKRAIIAERVYIILNVRALCKYIYMRVWAVYQASRNVMLRGQLQF
jgi:hypothetical protein